jgi:hypothetical protein
MSRPVKQSSGSVAIACEVRKSKAKLKKENLFKYSDIRFNFTIF